MDPKLDFLGGVGGEVKATGTEIDIYSRTSGSANGSYILFRDD